MRLAIASTALVVWAACLPTPVHHCASNQDCGGDGVCVAVVAGDQRCALADTACDSTLRWSDDAGDLADSCVAGAAPLDWDPCLPQSAAAEHTDTCTESVCAEEPRCCTREWSDQCVELADRTCNLRCGGAAVFVGPATTWVGGWDGNQYELFWSDDGLAGHNIDAVAWADYDGDHLPDFATCEDGMAADAAIRIYHNTGSDWTVVKRANTGFLCTDLDWVDLDGDGHVDVVAGGAYEIDWVRNDNGLFEDVQTVIDNGFVADIDWADVDADGTLDPVVARYEDSAQMFANKGSSFPGLFDTGDDASGPRYEVAAYGDVDATGGIDLLLAGDSFVRVFPNTSSSAFSAGPRTLEGPAEEVNDAAFLDADEDGDLDVVTLSTVSPMRVYRNDYDGGAGDGFTTTPLWDSGTSPFPSSLDNAQLEIADVDGDGGQHEDLVICVPGDFCQMWSGNGDGTFTKIWDPPGTDMINGFALIDDWR